MKNKRNLLLLIILILIFLIIKKNIFGNENVYIVFKKESFFFKIKKENRSVFFYTKTKLPIELSTFENKKTVVKSIDHLEKLNIVTIDSLSKVVPNSEYETVNWSKKRIEEFKKMKVFIIEMDSLNNQIQINEVYQPFTEY